MRKGLRDPVTAEADPTGLHVDGAGVEETDSEETQRNADAAESSLKQVSD
jgi:hypothetical protein